MWTCALHCLPLLRTLKRLVTNSSTVPLATRRSLVSAVNIFSGSTPTFWLNTRLVAVGGQGGGRQCQQASCCPR